MKICTQIALFFLLPAMVWGQNSRIQKSTLKIGEQTFIFYELTLQNENDAVRFEPKMGLISCEVVNKNSQVSSGKKINLEIIGKFQDGLVFGSKIKWIGKYKVTSWDTGYFEIPAPTIVWKDSMLNFQAIRFKVVPTKLIQGKEIMESDIVLSDIPSDSFYWLKSNIWWMILIVLAALTFWWYRRRRNFLPEPKKIETSLKNRTLLAIESLDRSKLWEKGKLKDHYIEMSYVLRSYLGVQYQLNLLECTSFQTKFLLSTKGLSDETVETIKLILDQADMVKFAKSEPNEIEILKISALAKQIVAETSPIEFDV